MIDHLFSSLAGPALVAIRASLAMARSLADRPQNRSHPLTRTATSRLDLRHLHLNRVRLSGLPIFYAWRKAAPETLQTSTYLRLTRSICLYLLQELQNLVGLSNIHYGYVRYDPRKNDQAPHASESILHRKPPRGISLHNHSPAVPNCFARKNGGALNSNFSG